MLKQEKRDDHQKKMAEILVNELYRDVPPFLIIIHPVIFTLIKRVIKTRMLRAFKESTLFYQGTPRFLWKILHDPA